MKTSPYTVIRLPALDRRPRAKSARAIPLSDPGAAMPSFDVGESASESESEEARAAAELKPELADISPAEAADLRRDEQTLVIPPMPLSLIEPDPSASPEVVREDDDAEWTWGIEAIGAHASPYTGKKVKVAVLDTGIDLDHEAFGRLLDEERVIVRNFVSGPEHDVSDTDGHGTHVAATICGDPVDGLRIGVAPGISQLLVAKVLGPGTGTNALVSALLWAMDKGADIVSMSLGVDFPGRVQSLVEDHDMPIKRATSLALEDYRHTLSGFQKLTELLSFRQVMIIAATGNESQRPDYTINEAPPAAAEKILSVAALERRRSGELGVAPFSNTNAELAAPGVAIRSAKAGGGLVARNGTSMAAPHVAGAAALWSQYLYEQRGAKPDSQVLWAKLVGAATLDDIAADSRAVHDIGSGLVRAPASNR